MNFVALDVETANSDLSSICQIGAVVFRDGSVSETWETLVNPQEWFDGMNVSVHGITEETVKDAPTFPQVSERLRELLSGRVVVHHTAFDKVSVSRVLAKHRHDPIECRWLDSARVVRKTWAEFSQRGYGLANVTKTLGIEFRHHQAAEDARAAGEILIRAIAHSGIPLDDWHGKVNSYRHTREGNQDGALSGEVVVFTGSLAIPRREAADMAARMGCDVADNVTKATTIVVVGSQDIRRLASQEKSNKHRKAEDLMAKGQPLRILAEDDFARLSQMD